MWWKCNKGPDHEWEATVSNRTGRRSGCPFCDGKRVSVTNSLTTCFPEVAEQWHPTKNGDLMPHQITSHTHIRVWWKCKKGPDHEWDNIIHDAIRKMEGKTIEYGFLQTNDIEDMDYLINKIYTFSR